MQLRYRILLLVGIILLGILLLFVGTYYYLIGVEVTKGTDEIQKQIVAMGEFEQKGLESFWGNKIRAVDAHTTALFKKLMGMDWFRQRYVPSDFNYQTKGWASAAIILATNNWLDFAQITMGDQLSAQVVCVPPYLRDFIRIPVDQDFSVVVRKEENGRYSTFVGVPYWSTDAKGQVTTNLGELYLQLEEGKVQWLIFSLDQILNMQVSQLEPAIEKTSGGLSLFASEETKKAYFTLMKGTIASIGALQQKLKKLPDFVAMLKSPIKGQEWIVEQLKKMSSSTSDVPSDHSVVGYMNWGARENEGSLAWQLAMITGAGIWDYDPHNPFAPLGICSFYRKNPQMPEEGVTPGKGILTDDVFRTTPIDISATCESTEIRGDYGACVIPGMRMDILRDSTWIFLTKTLIFTDVRAKVIPVPVGKLTVGMNMTPLIQELSIDDISNILFLTGEGDVIAFDKNGSIKEKSMEKETLFHLLSQKEGSILDFQNQEYYFFPLTSFLNQKNRTLMLEVNQNQFALIDQLKKQTSAFFQGLILQNTIVFLIAFVIAYFLLNHVIKKATRPIGELAAVTKQIGAGNLDLVKIPEDGKKRTDETGMLCRSFEKMVAEMKEGIQVRAVLNKVVSKEIAEKILREGIKLGGEMREVTVFFCDIRHFTHISEHMEPPAVLEMLNDCLTVLSHVIDDFEGVIDKYVGDEIMALFGAPIDIENHGLQAILCAKMMMKVLQEWNRQREQIGAPTLSIGIGIHTGPVIAGNMGAENHLTYTVIGHNVNLASRVCDYAKEMEILITENTLKSSSVKELIKYETLPPAVLRGISQPIPIFRIDPFD